MKSRKRRVHQRTPFLPGCADAAEKQTGVILRPGRDFTKEYALSGLFYPCRGNESVTAVINVLMPVFQWAPGQAFIRTIPVLLLQPCLSPVG